MSSRVQIIENGDMKISNNRLFLAISILTALMSVAGAVLMFNLISDFEFSFENIFGVVFVSVWICVVFTIGFTSFIMFSKVLILSDKGVLCKSVFKSRFLDWSEIKDFGLSYCGQTRFEGNTYYLYFSKNVLKQKNDERKIVKGVKFKVYVLESECDEIAEKVFAYCKKYTCNEPFVPKIKHHTF